LIIHSLLFFLNSSVIGKFLKA